MKYSFICHWLLHLISGIFSTFISLPKLTGNHNVRQIFHGDNKGIRQENLGNNCFEGWGRSKRPAKEKSKESEYLKRKRKGVEIF